MNTSQEIRQLRAALIELRKWQERHEGLSAIHEVINEPALEELEESLK